MHKINLLRVIIGILLTACQRETAIDAGLQSTTGDSSLLIKRIDESMEPGLPGKAVNINEYEYDAGKKLIRYFSNAVNGNKSWFEEYIYVRDSKGRIISIETKSQRFLNGIPYETSEGPAADTSISFISYKDSSENIDYIKKMTRSGARTAIDSIVYMYDNNGHVKETAVYQQLPGIHQPGDTLIAPDVFMFYTFDAAGSLTQLEQYNLVAGSLVLQIRYRFEFDTKTNPLFRSRDDRLQNWFELSPHNVVKQNVYIPQTGEDYDNTAVYQYRTDGNPSSVTYFSPPTVVSSQRKSTYFYK